MDTEDLEEDIEDNPDIKNITFLDALMVPGVLQFSFSFFFIKFAYYGVYYWIPDYLQDGLGYDLETTGEITSFGSVGGIIGSLLMGLLSDILAVKSAVHFVGCLVGAICLSLITSVHGTDHTVFLTLLLSTFYVFENGATIVIAIIQCEIGKNQLLNSKRKAVATISGICDGLAGFGSILGQFLVGPAEAWRGLPGVFAMFSIGAFIAPFTPLPYMCREVRKCLRQRRQRNQQYWPATRFETTESN